MRRNNIAALRYAAALTLAFLWLCAPAQDDLMDMLDAQDVPAKEKTTATFKTTRLVNAHSIETMKEGALDFRITHRFGSVGKMSGGGIHTLYGFDNASNIRFSLEYGISDRLMAGLGRSKVKEHLDGFLKYRLLEQTQDGSMPVGLAVFTNLAVTPMADGDDIWRKALHRFSYASQLVIARKFSPSFSLELLPTYLHRNFVRAYTNPANGAPDESELFSIGAGARLKVTSRLAIIADYFYTFSEFRSGNTDMPHYAPLGVGIEIETGGHVFHLNFTNSSGIIENDFIPDTRESWADGGMKFGFNISRVFQLR